MPRTLVYGIGLTAFLAGIALTLASMWLPHWIDYTSPSSGPDPARVSYGLHTRCNSVTGTCEPFPQQADCAGGEDRGFCSLWRSVGFLMNFAVVLELAGLVGFAVVLLGGRGAREGGWKVVGGIMGLVALCEAAGMGIVIGWGLGTSTVLCTLSWVVMGLSAAGMGLAARILPPEDDYEQIE